MKRRLLGVLVCLGVLASGTAGAARAAVAPDPPGVQSYFDLARKDCVGTARNTGSKVWFTVADGVLSDVYWPTVDATNVHTLQYLVTDGTHLHGPADPRHELPGEPGRKPGCRAP